MWCPLLHACKAQLDEILLNSRAYLSLCLQPVPATPDALHMWEVWELFCSPKRGISSLCDLTSTSNTGTRDAIALFSQRSVFQGRLPSNSEKKIRKRFFKVVSNSLSLWQEKAGLSEIQRASLGQGKRICARCL